MKNTNRLVAALLILILTFSLSACSMPFIGDKSADEKTSEETAKEEETETYFTADTTVSYSSGSDSNWSYGNQRKEFPQNESCYVRIGSKVITPKNKTVGAEIAVTYRFTGVKNCKVDISDGIAQENIIDDNVVEFTRILSADKEKKATESIVIFKYSPTLSADNVVVEVLYDDHVAAKYDVHNTVYFSPASAEEIKNS